MRCCVSRTRAGKTEISRWWKWTQSALTLVACSLLPIQVQGEDVRTARGLYRVDEAGIRSEPLAPDYLTILGITLGKDSLQDAQRILGDTPVTLGTHGERRLCYTVHTPRQSSQLYLEAGPLGGFRDLTSFTLTFIDAGRQTAKHCRRIEVEAETVAISAGLALGMPKSKIIELLGPPSGELKRSLLWFYRSTGQSEAKRTPDDTDRSRSPTASSESNPEILSFIECAFSYSTIRAITVTHIQSL
jgi:hypothetical protein